MAEHLEAFSADFHKYVPLVKGDPDVIVEIIPTAEGKDRCLKFALTFGDFVPETHYFNMMVFSALLLRWLEI